MIKHKYHFLSNCTHRVLRRNLLKLAIVMLPTSYLIALIEYCDNDCFSFSETVEFASYLIALIEYCDFEGFVLR